MSNPDFVKILSENRNIAVVGLSPNPWRPSYEVSSYMLNAGYNIIPVNPNYQEVLGRKCYASLLDIKEPIEIINVFRNSEYVPKVVEEALAIKAKIIWLQLGVWHPAAVARAEAAGITVVANRCIKVEHARHRAALKSS